MLKLAVSYDFKTGRAIDLSGNGNHGRTANTSLVPGSTTDTKALFFNGNNSRIIIDKSASFVNMGALKIEVVMRIHEYGHRHNILEGSGSFAFFVNDDGTIRGTVNDGSVRWRGLDSSAKIPLHKWTNVQYVYDGFSSGRLFIDGNLAAEDYDMRVPIPEVSSDGVHIGNWPVWDGVYPMHGEIALVKIWRLDDVTTPAALYVGLKMTPDKVAEYGKVIEFFREEAKRSKEKGELTCLDNILLFLDEAVYLLKRNNKKVVEETDRFSIRFFKALLKNPQGAEMKKLSDDYFKFLSQNVPEEVWKRILERAKGIEAHCFGPTQLTHYREVASMAARVVDKRTAAFQATVDKAFTNRILRNIPRNSWPQTFVAKRSARSELRSLRRSEVKGVRKRRSER